MNMTRKRALPSIVNDRIYRQTDISTYFKVTNRANFSTMSDEQTSTNKENDLEEPVLSPRKKSKPIPSDGETEEIINALIGPLQRNKKTPKGVLRQYEYQQSTTTILKLPIPLPDYTYSEDSDSEGHCTDKPVTQTQRKRSPTTRQALKRNSQPTLSVSSKKKKKQCNINLNIAPVVISSDEDFEVTPTKTKKAKKPLLSRKKLTSQQTLRKVNDLLERNVPSHTCKKLFQSSNVGNISQEENADTSGISSMPCSSKAIVETPPHTIGVHSPTKVSKTVRKPQPRILVEKRNSNSDISRKSAEFVSIDFSEKSCLKILSTSAVSSVGSDDTVVYEHNLHSTDLEVQNSTPKRIKVLENIIISENSQTLEQCTLSPIRDNAGIDGIMSSTEDTVIRNSNTVTRADISRSAEQCTLSPIRDDAGIDGVMPSTSSTWLKNTQDTMIRNSNTITEADTSKSAWTTALFTKIVKYIGLHSHLKTMLTANESDMLKRFFSMPKLEYQFFCFKLFTRIQKWYNIFKLRNDLRITLSDPEMKNMYDCLYENKFVEIDFSEEPCIDLLDHLQKKELKEIGEAFKIKFTNQKKCEMVQKLLTNCNRQTTLTVAKSTERILRDRIKQKMGICVKLSPILYKLFDKVHLLYSFTTSDFNKASDLHFFLSKIINKEIFMPKINVNMDVRIFSSIAQFSRFADACECKRAMVEAFDNKQIGQMLELSELAYRELQNILECDEEQKPSYLMRFTAGYKYTKTLAMGAKYLTRHYHARVEEWLTFLIEQDQYCLELRGIWCDLLVMVQYRYLELYETAANTLIEALDRKDLSEVHMQELSYRAENMKGSKAHKISELLHNKICFVQPPSLREFPFIEIDAQAIYDETGRKGKRLYMKKGDGEQRIMSVEDIALEHYYKQGYANGLHCEGSLLVTIYFVLFWDIIYESAVPDAFILELQYFPLDLFSPEFYTNRKSEIDQRIDEIRSKWPYGQLELFISKIWEQHAHEKSYINDGLVNEAKDLYNIILCIGRVKLAQILERIAKNFKAYRSGLPDLFLWTVQEKKCKFVEVKGERDTLSAKQKLWLDFLLSVGADAEVCHVHTVGSKTGRKMLKIKKENKKQEKKPIKGSAFIK